MLDRVAKFVDRSHLPAGDPAETIAAAAERGIAVGNTPGVLTDATADFAFALLLAAARRIGEAIDYVRAGKWHTWGLTLLLGQEVHGAALGIIGMGRPTGCDPRMGQPAVESS